MRKVGVVVFHWQRLLGAPPFGTESICAWQTAVSAFACGHEVQVFGNDRLPRQDGEKNRRRIDCSK